MLVLSRKTNEIITIGNHITVTVVEIRGDKVRIGIDAPKSVEVWRGELQDIPVVKPQVRYAVQLNTDWWLGEQLDDGYGYVRTVKEARKFATEAEAGAALIEERKIANWMCAAVKPVEAR